LSCSAAAKTAACVFPPYVGEDSFQEKFISTTDVVTTTITSDRPVTLRVEGRSFQSGNSLTLNGSCSVDVASNSVLVREGGTVTAKVSESPEVLKEAVLMYDGMTGVLSSDQPLEDVSIHDLSPGLCGYSFSLPLDSQGLSLAWTMNDDKDTAVTEVRKVLANPSTFGAEKTTKMNDMLNNLVPYFRCSDEDIVKVYYFLWSLQLMYYKDPGTGMRAQPTTQTAVNNFLGLHRFDAVF